MTEDVIWESILDGTYKCKVVRSGEYKGTLSIEDSAGEIIHSQDVGLSYDALLGPDASDVAEWQDVCVEVIDAL